MQNSSDLAHFFMKTLFFQYFFLFFFSIFIQNPSIFQKFRRLKHLFFNPGQDLPKGLWSRDPFQPPYIVFTIFPRLNFEIAARAGTGGLPDLPISRILRVFYKTGIKSI